MDIDKDYMSIKDFAETVGRSQQAIHQSARLKPFIKQVDNRKFIHRNALELFNSTIQSTVSTEALKVDKGVEPPTSLLEEQLKEKDKQIDRLQEEVKALRLLNEEQSKHIMEQSRQLITLMEQANQLQQNNQILLGMAQTKDDDRAAEPAG